MRCRREMDYPRLKMTVQKGGKMTNILLIIIIAELIMVIANQFGD